MRYRAALSGPQIKPPVLPEVIPTTHGENVRLRFPRTRMGKFTLILITLWVLRVLVPSAAQQSFPLVLALLTLLLVIPLGYYSWKLFALVRTRLLWKIRRRLIVAHILIAAIPLALMVVILYVSGLLFYYQLSFYLIENQIGIHTAQIQAFNDSLNTELQQLSAASEPAAFKAVLERDSKYLLSIYRAAAIVMRIKDPATGKYVVYTVGNVKRDAGDYQVPRWVSDSGFTGLVYEDVQPALYGVQDKQTRRGQIYLRSLVVGDFRNEFPYSVEVSVPLDGEMLDRLKTALGQDLVLADHVPSTGLNVMLQDTNTLSRNILYATFDLNNQQEALGRPVWSMPLFPRTWSKEKEEEGGPTDTMLFVEISTSKLIQNVFRSDSIVSRTILGALELVVGFFLIVEILSLIGGIFLIKSITNAVHNLDRGTEFVRRGDFSHRIVVKSDDQLGALAKSFNQMTEYVQTLVKERVQKERLERELEIAKEVQEQLFPKRAPQMSRMELTGLCLPARIVSGDYYDFLQLDDRSMGLALGDICGKGISAALLMANLQATLRSNVMMQHERNGNESADGSGSIAAIVRVLNHQIYSFTSANKFASFFYGVYNDAEGTLSYCNAGHNPPLYFHNDDFHRLSTGGTVVGIFPDAEFEQETIRLQSGDLLVAYTDGIVESVNEYGEEFGEHRLIDLVRSKRDFSAERMQKAIVDEVLGWAFEEERDDDMTLIVARFH